MLNRFRVTRARSCFRRRQPATRYQADSCCITFAGSQSGRYDAQVTAIEEKFRRAGKRLSRPPPSTARPPLRTKNSSTQSVSRAGLIQQSCSSPGKPARNTEAPLAPEFTAAWRFIQMPKLWLFELSTGRRIGATLSRRWSASRRNASASACSTTPVVCR